VVYPLINNYKAQRNVRAELGGAVDLGEPVSLYIAEDEVKYGSKNLIPDGDFETGDVVGNNAGSFVNGNGAGSNKMDVFEISTSNSASGAKSLHCTADTDNQRIYVPITTKIGQAYRILINIKITNHHTSNANLRLRCGNAQNGTDHFDSASYVLNPTTDMFLYSLFFTATATTTYFTLRENGGSNNVDFYVDNARCYELIDHTYKLMAVNDTIPAQSVDTEANGNMSDLLSSGTKTALNDVLNGTNNVMDFEDGSDGFNLIVANAFTKPLGNGATFAINSNLGRLSNGAANQGQVSLAFTTVSGRTYDISFDIEAVNSTELQASLGATSAYNSDAAVTTSGVDNDYNLATRFTATGTTSYLYLQLNTSTSGHYVDIDDLMIYEVFGYDYYNAPAYKFGIVSSVYDKDTGAMKTTGAAGDQLDVTVQGECNLRGPNGSATKDKLLSKIGSNGDPTDLTVADAPLPNAVGVITETVSGDTTFPIILFQGVEFSEHFVHKNSLQVKAKCAETITKFRPVSLFLDSNGDLLCRHDDIPETTPDSDTDHTGVDPGKWGIAELGGVSGEIIPVTVAGKTHINTSFNLVEGAVIRQIKEDGGVYESSNYANYVPNALGTTLKTGTGDVPISIFNGTPIGTITDWKRTIKVTAKANGAITQYRPVSLYLDQYGNYKCISDDIPNVSTDSNNGVWCDFRKWGVAQETVDDGENVEIIVQGRTNVEDVESTSPARGGYVLKITATGAVTATSSSGYQLSSLGVVEKVAKLSDGTPGTIIIF